MKINNRFFLVILFLIVPLILTGCAGGGRQPETKEEVAPTPESTYHQLSLEEKPFFSLKPYSAHGGVSVDIGVANASGFDSIEYEVVYFSDKGGQGFQGELKLMGKNSAEDKDRFFGSESSGKFTADTNVSRGNITFRLYGEKRSKLKTSFSLENIPFSGGKITSVDEKVTVNFPRGGFYLILMDPIGLPQAEKPQQEIIAGPYALFSLASLSSFTIDFKEEGQILAWNETKETWEEIAPGKSTSLTTFVLVSE